MEDQNARRALFGVGTLMVLIIGFSVAISAAAAAGGMATAFTAVLFEPSVRQVSGYICPAGTEVNIYSVRRSYHEPGESEQVVECISPDGSVQDVTGRALGITVGGSFVAGFLLCCIPLSLGTLLIALYLARQAAKQGPGGSPPVAGPRIEQLG